MTLEINEIGITMRVRSDPAAPTAATTESEAPNAATRAATERDELIEICVRRVLRALRASQER